MGYLVDPDLARCLTMVAESPAVPRHEPTQPGVHCELDDASPGNVRDRVRAMLADRSGIVVDDAVLVADELVSNALRHGQAPRSCRLTMLHRGRRLRIEVEDASPQMPKIRTPDHTGGRGLILVDRLATSWGFDPHGDSKTVWAELVLDTPGSSGHARHLAPAPDRSD
jgi:hypothetical protein